MEDKFQKPASSGRKSHERKRLKKPQADIIVDRMEKTKKVKIQGLNIVRKVCDFFFDSCDLD